MLDIKQIFKEVTSLKEGRTPTNLNHDNDVEFIKRYVNADCEKSAMTSKIQNEYRRYLKAINAYDHSLLDGLQNPNLFQLKKIVDDNDIVVKKSITQKSIPQHELDDLMQNNGIDKKKAIDKWKALQKKYVKILNNAGLKLSNDVKMSLEGLKGIASANDIELDGKKKTKDWEIFEKDVVNGVQQLLDSGKIIVDGVPLQKGVCEVKNVGGGLMSDVKVVNTSNDKSFFIECKLNFDNARYFKYGVEIMNGKAHYNHHRYIEGKKNDEEIEKIDDLFNEKINLDAFLNELLNSKEVKESWKQFTDNVDDMCKWLKDGEWFDGTADKRWKQLFKNIALEEVDGNDIPDDADEPIPLSFKTGKYPENFKDICKVFDIYVKYYIDSYNGLIDYIVKNIPDVFDVLYANSKEDFDPEDLKIPHKKMGRSSSLVLNELFNYASRMQANVAAYKDIADEINDTLEPDENGELRGLDDGKSVIRVAQRMQQIEVKMNALLKHLKKNENDFNALLSIEPKDKLKYFFKLFLSSVGRKAKNASSNPLLSQDAGKLGNMMLCPETIVENTHLAQMITDFYVKKDGCAYIQIADTAYAFVDGASPLGICNLPVFKDAITKFKVWLSVNDALDQIRLQVGAVPLDAKVLSGKLCISFVPKHANFVCKALKTPIEVHIKDKKH